jgi:L,D-transpeptidase catalytic domain
MRRPTFLALTFAAALTVMPAAASAQTPTTPTETQPAPQPPMPKPRAGRMSISVHGGLATRQLRYFQRGQTVVVRGIVRPFVPRQVADLYVVRGRAAVAHERVRIRKGRGPRGVLVYRFVARRSGRLRIVARHRRTARQVAFGARDRSIAVARWSAGAGARGLKVLLLQRGLLKLGFAVPVSGYFGGGTARAVTAFRKTNLMGRGGFAGPRVYGKVFRHQGAFRLRHPHAGRHVEFDWSRQVLVLANRGRPFRVYHASSGKPSTPTVFGTFRFYRKAPGTNSHGMVYSNYFIGGYAVHGYASVPSYPASHGCIRVPIPNAIDIYNRISLGETIFVYR